MAKFSLIILICLCGIAVADIYLHFPPGSNDRNREQKDNRDNAQRLFDSENNAKGGYPYCGSATLPGDTDGYEFYAESRLRIEWTLQHSCGSEANALCNTILQYMCSDSIGDGYPTGSEIQNQDPGYSKAEFLSTANNRQNQDGTATIPFPSSLNGGGPAFGDTSFDNDPEVYTKFYSGEIKTPWNRVEFGYHEPFEHYKKCIKTQRNSGLYTADRRLNGQSQRFTRQNPGGTRHGLECPEERDYYPHWSPSPWKDIAVFTSNTDWCPYYRENSENVKGRWFCELDATTQLIPITENDCKAAAGRWKQASSHGIKAPECLAHPISRDNHLGNVMGELPTNAKGSTDMATYDWIIPKDLEGKKCVIRMRYNMSSGDYNSMNWLHSKDSFDSASHGEFSDYTKNCPSTGNDNPVDDNDINLNPPNPQCQGKLTTDVVPLYNRPFVSISKEDEPKLSIAFNTNQIGRTFQDRSYVFRVRKAIVSGNVINLNYRGCRGNIVQCYPSVEYDFVPNNLVITESDHLHIQFCGSDFTANRNANNGEGWRFSSRTNMLQASSSQSNFPLPVESTTMWDKDTAKKMAYVGMDHSSCDRSLEGNNENTANNDPKNCAKLNPAPARFDGGLHKFKKGVYHYLSTRNNNFSNRSQKGTLRVEHSFSRGEVAGMVIGGLVTLCFLAGFGLFIKSRKSPGGFPSRLFPNAYTSANTSSV